jgi:hypothetical protein
MGGNSFYIFLVESRGHSLAAISTGKAFRFLPHFRFQQCSRKIQSLWWILLELAEVAPHFIFALSRFMFEGPETKRHNLSYLPKVKKIMGKDPAMAIFVST